MSGRPEILFPLFADLETLEGVGPKTAAHFAQMGVEKPRDLIFTLPHSGIDRQRRESVRDVTAPAVVTVEAVVGRHIPPSARGRPYRVEMTDAKTTFQLVFFHAHPDYLQKILPTGQRRVVSGKVEIFDGIAQIVHPDHVLRVEEAGEIPAFEPVYPLTSGITQRLMAKAMQSALARAPKLAEWIDSGQKQKAKWPDWEEALAAAHAPKTHADLA
ncbi:MAG TPA: ATP-dependent DNA helicase RecG, partial [Rhodobacteraceae bacterium]|nr:ATP-dependent DNA helicase RecG [Paracoccaceae bacterium]